MRKKMSYNFKCPYYDKVCDAKIDEFTVTRRKTMQYFHRACYEVNTKKNEFKEL